jgi:hypothetical protein
MPHQIAVIFQINGNRGKNSGNSDEFNRAQFKRPVQRKRMRGREAAEQLLLIFKLNCDL